MGKCLITELNGIIKDDDHKMERYKKIFFKVFPEEDVKYFRFAGNSNPIKATFDNGDEIQIGVDGLNLASLGNKNYKWFYVDRDEDVTDLVMEAGIGVDLSQIKFLKKLKHLYSYTNSFNCNLKLLASCTSLSDLEQSSSVIGELSEFAHYSREYGRTEGKITFIYSAIVVNGTGIALSLEGSDNRSYNWDKDYSWIESDKYVVTYPDIPENVVQERTSSGGAWEGKTVILVEKV